jgi:hypothetical protein
MLPPIKTLGLPNEVTQGNNYYCTVGRVVAGVVPSFSTTRYMVMFWLDGTTQEVGPILYADCPLMALALIHNFVATHPLPLEVTTNDDHTKD